MDYDLSGDYFLVAGREYTYSLLPRNISANRANDVLVVDTLHHNGYLSVKSSAGCQVTPGASKTMLRCQMGSIDADSASAPKTITWSVAPNAPEGAVVTQEGEVSVQDPTAIEKSTLDNILNIDHAIVRQSDLTLQASTTALVAGNVMTITGTVGNAGPSYANDTVVSIYIPDNISPIKFSNSCVRNGQFLECPVGELAVRQNKKVFASFRLDPGYRGTLETLLIASSASSELNEDDNYAFIDSQVAATTRLRATMTPERASALEGDAVNYQIDLKNDGPSTATNVSVDVTTPESAYIEKVRVRDVNASLEQLTIAAGATLTATVTVRFLEDDHGTATRLGLTVTSQEAATLNATSAPLRIANVAPTATLSGALTINEGEVGLITVLTNDPGSDYDPFAIEWDLDNDGIFDDSDQPTIRFDARSLNGPLTRPIAVRVTDDEGGERTARGSVTILNVAPTVTTGPRQITQYDQSFTVPFQAFDPIAADVQSAQVDWGDGTQEVVPLQNGGKEEQAKHAYNKIGTFTATICVGDAANGLGCSKVVLQAACRDNGLIVGITQSPGKLVVTLQNASGTVAIPAGYPLTLYDGTNVVHTFQLDQALAVGASRTLEHPLASDSPRSLRLVADDNGSGAKTTDLCSGKIAFAVQQLNRLFLPFIGTATKTGVTSPIEERSTTVRTVFSSYVSRRPR